MMENPTPQLPTIVEPCKFFACKFHGAMRVILSTGGVHYARVECPTCNGFQRWLPKPESDPTKYRRPNSHRDLVKAFSKGYCELCLRKKENLPKGQTIEAQHVLEFQDGGSSERENIWILCTACHRLVHWVRTYHASPVEGGTDDPA